jgi:DNA-binding NarL/FixJ family response regulator
MGARVLIVEDDFLQAESLEALLELEGHSVCGTAASGRDALMLAETTRPDVVFVDVCIKGSIDGIETARLIKSAAPCRVIFLTAYSDARSVDRMRGAGPDAILSKPSSLKTIMAAVDRALGA